MNTRKRIVLLRHGQSLWNRENRFTGWTDVDLSDDGVAEAVAAGKLLRAEGLTFDAAYTSYLKRAVRTLDIVLSTLDLDWIPVEKSWRLNEKHYGVLQGLDKSRTDYDTAPDPLPADDRRNPRFDSRYASVPGSLLPLTESLRQTVARTLPYWQCVIYPALARYDSILVVAHGNSLRGIVKHLKGISDSAIADLNLPTAAPVSACWRLLVMATE